MRAFGEVLVENRKRKGYSQADLVDLLAQEGIEVPTKAVSKWENLTRIDIRVIVGHPVGISPLKLQIIVIRRVVRRKIQRVNIALREQLSLIHI